MEQWLLFSEYLPCHTILTHFCPIPAPDMRTSCHVGLQAEKGPSQPVTDIKALQSGPYGAMVNKQVRAHSCMARMLCPPKAMHILHVSL